ncbi:MAG: ribbon-helix-helix protein, CopG family [Actinomycetota bacterium]|nr:ribbon-helix-helix protein, CopG family [Actinomycetota bacterium]
MKRITIYLPVELKAALERTAAAQGRSQSEVVRAALSAATAAYPRPRLLLFRSGDPTLAERVDEELAAGFPRTVETRRARDRPNAPGRI